MKEMSKNKVEPFDMVFIDADKGNYLNYYKVLLGTSIPSVALLTLPSTQHQRHLDVLLRLLQHIECKSSI